MMGLTAVFRFIGAGAAFIVGVATGDPALTAEGWAGMGETSLSLGGSITGLAIPYAPAAITRGVGKGAREIIKSGANFTERQLRHFEKQLAQHVRESLVKSRENLEKRLNKHLQDLEEYKKQGGYTSSVEREIRNFRGQIEAIDEILRR